MENQMTVSELVKDIKSTVTQTSVSQKDETRYMKTMLNDRSFQVTDAKNPETTYCPAQSARDMVASVIQSAAKIPAEEARTLADAHEFKNSEANNMIDVSKAFVSGYVETGRKLQLGGNMGVGISLKHVPAGTKTYPKRVGVDEAGKAIYQNSTTQTAAYDTLKVHR